jgi:hypothetical protein
VDGGGRDNAAQLIATPIAGEFLYAHVNRSPLWQLCQVGNTLECDVHVEDRPRLGGVGKPVLVGRTKERLHLEQGNYLILCEVENFEKILPFIETTGKAFCVTRLQCGLQMLGLDCPVSRAGQRTPV